jgi:hypothetical protein
VGRSKLLLSVKDLQSTDRRAPIVFLRSFRDDQVQLRPSVLDPLGRILSFGEQSSTLDEILVNEGTAIGPVVALGNPVDQVQPFGAARSYESDENWRRTVIRLCDASRFIVLCLDNTPGVEWEINEIFIRGYSAKTLFILNPGIFRTKEGVGQASGLMSLLARTWKSERYVGEEDRVLGFFVDNNGKLLAAEATAATNYTYTAILRWYCNYALHRVSP